MSSGVYLHIPFCKSRCSYCDFATDVFRSETAVQRYVDALKKEIETNCSAASVNSIYFGGGTPSILEPIQAARILEAVRARFVVDSNVEITIEMNPATVTAEKLSGYRSLGVNRASFGVQTFNETHLKLLSRGHDAADARNTFRLLRDNGFDNISFDLIAGLPGQTLDDWKSNLNEAIRLDPQHISLYLLEVHEGTPLAEQIQSGRRPTPDAALAAEMYEFMVESLSAEGFEQYEISNFARSGFESRHNTKYWKLDPVFGFGVSAHSFDGRERYANERDTNRYVELVETIGSAEVFREKINQESEFLFLGLRLNRGINLIDFADRFGFDLLSKYDSAVQRFSDLGLLELSDESLRLTQRGRLYSNEVFTEFV